MHQEKRLLCVNEMWGNTESTSDGVVQLEQLFRGCLGEELLQVVAFTFGYLGFCLCNTKYCNYVLMNILSRENNVHFCGSEISI